MKNNILKAEALNELKALLGPENIKENEVMAAHLTMEVGGEANYFLTPATAESLKEAMAILKREAMPCYILGKGSNVIVRDEGFDGTVVHIGDNMSDIVIEGNVCRAQAGALLKDVSEKIADASLTGFEFACGIPGSVGGAITMNAGAYDSDMSHIVKEVTLLRDDGEIITVKGSDMGFGYR
ncbi:MAG: FAD-binding protein, partial [Parasporobacterium sp.]|nr:FAD-binding protein [Parasporobacterium sp.]